MYKFFKTIGLIIKDVWFGEDSHSANRYRNQKNFHFPRHMWLP